MSLKFNNSLIYKVQQANDIVDVISEHLRLDRKGKEFLGLCPFHEDHKPSFYVSPAKQIFKCFACSAGGDVIKFTQMRENLTFPEAIERLAKRAGIDFKPVEHSASPKAPSAIDPKQLEKINLWAARFFRSNLEDTQKGQQAREYLAKRQISQESIKIWGIGAAVDSWDNLTGQAKQAGISEKHLLAAGLAVEKSTSQSCYDKFRNRLMFPIIDTTGRVIGFGGRTLGDDPAKYMNSPTTELFDKSNCLYGLNQARHEIVSSSTAVVVEGYTDVIMAHQFGCKTVVATLGTSFTQGHARLLRRFAKKIVLIFDSDVAGSEAANRALEVCLRQKIDIKIASVPQGKDPCDFLLAQGADAFKAVIDSAVDVLEYKWQKTKSAIDNTDNITDSKKAVESFLDSIAAGISGGNVDQLSANLIVGRLSKITGIEPSVLKEQLKNRTAKIKVNDGYNIENNRVVSISVGQGYYEKAQQEIIEVLLNRPELFENIKENISLKMFTEPILNGIASALFDVLSSGTDGVLAKTLAQFESADMAQLVVEMESDGQKNENYQQRLDDCIKVFAQHQMGNQTPKVEQMDDEQLRHFTKKAAKPNMRNAGLRI